MGTPPPAGLVYLQGQGFLQMCLRSWQEGPSGQRALAPLTRVSPTVMDDWNGKKATADGQASG